MGTHDLHMALHENPLFTSLLGRTASPSDYRHILARLYGFYRPLDRHVLTALQRDGTDDYRYQPRHELLEADLAALGMPRTEARRLPRCPALPPLSTTEQVIGALYVVEGSALGARIVYGRLNDLLPGDAAAGRSYFGWGAGPERRNWHLLCDRVEAQALLPGGVERMVRSARRTFACLSDWLDRDAVGTAIVPRAH